MSRTLMWNNKAFMNKTDAIRLASGPQDCLYLVDLLKEAADTNEHMNEILQQFPNLDRTDPDEALSFLKTIAQIFRSFQGMKNKFQKADAKLRDVCVWSNQNITVITRRWVQAKADILYAGYTFHRGSYPPRETRDILRGYKGENKKMNLSLNVAEAFLNENATKWKLASAVLSKDFQRAKSFHALAKHTLKQTLHTYFNEMNTAWDALNQGYSDLLSQEQPVLKRQNVFLLEIVKEALKINSTEGCLKPKLDELSSGSNFKRSFVMFLACLYSNFLKPMQYASRGIEKLVIEFLKSVDSLEKNLKHYKMDIEMESSFFL